MIPLVASCALLAAPCQRTDGAPVDPVDGAVALPVQLRPIATGCGRVVDLDEGPADVLFVTDQRGTVWRLPREGSAEKWLEVEVSFGGERGLLGLALHPAFADNGRLYTNRTLQDGERLVSRVEEWRVGPAGPRLHHLVYEVVQPFGNHNAGHLEFGPDGMLYVGWGDGGKAGDPFGHGQNRSTALGSMLRLDVDTQPFGVPPDNPFVGQEDVLPEIWAYGLRNPWRYTFDPQGRMVVADVGQNAWEEVGFLTSGDDAGWSVREGRSCFRGAACTSEGRREPFWSYGHDQGSSVTGGVVAGAGPLSGLYVLGDYVSGRLWALPLPRALDGVLDAGLPLGRFEVHPATFGRLESGHVLVADHHSGTIYQVQGRQ